TTATVPRTIAAMLASLVSPTFTASVGTPYLLPRSSADGRPRVPAPEELRPEHADRVDAQDVDHHRLGGGPPDADGPARRVVAVVTAHEHHERRHQHRLDGGVDEVQRVLELPEEL